MTVGVYFSLFPAAPFPPCGFHGESPQYAALELKSGRSGRQSLQRPGWYALRIDKIIQVGI
jgi:hypothetical protein